MNRAEKRHQLKLSRKPAKRDRALPPISHGHSASGNLALDPSRLVNQAIQLSQAGRIQDAAVVYQQVLAIDPGHAGALCNLGSILQAAGQLDQAVACYSRALASSPGFAEVHYNMATALAALDRREEAVASYRQAIAHKPDFAAAYSNLGNTLQGLGRLEEAVDACRAALAMAPDVAQTHGNLGTALHKLGRLDDAIASYHAALTRRPEGAVVWSNMRAAIKARDYPPDAFQEDWRGKMSPEIVDSAQFTLLEYDLAAYRPHQVGHAYDKAVAALPSLASEQVVVTAAAEVAGDSPRLPDKLVALLHFGRSGTGLLHSLIDGHPEISTLPSIYLRGFFNAGVWQSLTTQGWQALPERFADLYEVLFDATSARITPGMLGETNASLGIKEGMTTLGEGRDESLTVDREAFCTEARRLMAHYSAVNPALFLRIIHAAYEATLKRDTEKHTAFYHLHNPDSFTMLNFLRHTPDARLVMMVREPLQSCESWIRGHFDRGDYHGLGERIITMLFAIDRIAFRTQDAIGIRLEDLKARPEQTMGALCEWLEVAETPSLYEMTAQGRKWWGDPSSRDYKQDAAMDPFDQISTKRSVGAIFSEMDQRVLGTLFYPFSVRFGYREADPDGFRMALRDIRPLLDRMLDFEVVMAERDGIEATAFMRRGAYRLFRAGLLERWAVLDALGDYPNLLKPLEIPAL
jgi:tetratricopeptide (TPR) repeat protein